MTIRHVFSFRGREKRVFSLRTYLQPLIQAVGKPRGPVAVLSRPRIRKSLCIRCQMMHMNTCREREKLHRQMTCPSPSVRRHKSTMAGSRRGDFHREEIRATTGPSRCQWHVPGAAMQSTTLPAPLGGSVAISAPFRYQALAPQNSDHSYLRPRRKCTTASGSVLTFIPLYAFQ